MIIRSHPDKYLYTHLTETAQKASEIISRNSWNFSVLPNNILKDLAYIEGAFHDFGKCTIYFQDYLMSGGKRITGPKNHALLSALLSKCITEEYLADKVIGGFAKRLLPFFIFTSVRRHHGNLNNFTDELNSLEEKIDEVRKQTASLIRPETDDLVMKMLLPLGIQFDFNLFICGIQNNTFFKDYINFFCEIIKFGEYEELCDDQKIELFYLHELLYSVLLLSDKSDVILEKQVNYTRIKPGSMERFRKNKNFHNPASRIDRLKNKAYDTITANVCKVFSKDIHLYSLTLPTGLGKTITSFAAASVMKELLGDVNNRIIITIPFTSIIDQSYEVYSEILEYPDSTQLLKHHHLSEPSYKTRDDDLCYNQAEFLIESWNSQVVVSTFVQLFECFFSCEKSKLLKLPSISGSIIILDEVQNIDYKYWPLIRKAFQTIGRTYACYFILMSATQPLIFDPAGEITELVPNYRDYFRAFNRTKITFLSKDEISLDDLVCETVKYLQENPSDNVLIILNTKKAVKDCFGKLKSAIDTDKNELYFLSTLITPFERKIIIREIKKRKSPKRFIIVSTQLIEAGVDLSVDAVFREIAPLDSIIQAAGRANRYAEKNRICSIMLFCLSENKINTNKLYGAELIIKTKNVLDEFIKNALEEKEYLGMIERYFQEVKLQAEVIISGEMSNICKLDFASIKDFKLIQESRSEGVFVSINEKAEHLWSEFVKIYSNNETDIFTKMQEFSSIKSDFYDFIINVPIPYQQKQINIDTEKTFGFYYLNSLEGSNFYSYDPDNFSENTGYHTDETIFMMG